MKNRFKQRLIYYSILTFSTLFLLNGCKEEKKSYKYGDLATSAVGETDKEISKHGFIEIYEHIFSPLKDSTTRFCEIGIGRGGSLIMWSNFFKNADIFGIDIFKMTHLNTKRIKTYITDQSKKDQLKKFIEDSGGNFDIILDDGGHAMDQQQISFGYLFKHIKPGGYYIIEDVHTSLPLHSKGYGISDDEKNATLLMINNYIKTREIKSNYLTEEEIKYLNDNIYYCNLFFKNNNIQSITCVIKKK
ncbi:MAG: class I SAM-dependent methyltransferase [Candidatus Aureabacteria bacterium]|nr:class I SAM-dependent methyltransferase [Candidatus Auribacterota bacterium]